MVEMHLLTVNADFHYDSIFALGVLTSFERFMQGYRPEHDKSSIFDAICKSVSVDPNQYRHDGEVLKAEASQLTLTQFLEKLSSSNQEDNSVLSIQVRQIASYSQFKYSRLFAIGLYTLIETIDPEVLKSEKSRTETLTRCCEALNIPFEKVQKDLELYRSNLEKFAQAQLVMDDILKADRKRKEERAKEKDAIATPPATSQESN